MIIQALRKTARRFGVDVKRYSRMQRAVDNLVEAGKRPFFIQIGANNGIDFDDFYAMVVHHDLDGLVVEPIPDYFQALRYAYARHPKVVPINAAVHPTATSMAMYRVDPSSVTINWQHGLASFDRNHLLRHEVPENAIVEEKVDCLSFAKLLEYVPAGRHIDVLAIDTEGFDAEILRMIDFDRIRPNIIRFESKHMDESDLVHFTSLLNSIGYDVLSQDLDCLAILKS